MNWVLSYVWWSIWIFVLFLVPELLAHFHEIPLGTLSATSWHAEHTYPLLRTLLFGFLLGLAIHIRFETELTRAEASGMLIAVALHFVALI